MDSNNGTTRETVKIYFYYRVTFSLLEGNVFLCFSRLYCTWHVDEAWRNNINLKIPSKELRVSAEDIPVQPRKLIQISDEIK